MTPNNILRLMAASLLISTTGCAQPSPTAPALAGKPAAPTNAEGVYHVQQHGMPPASPPEATPPPSGGDDDPWTPRLRPRFGSMPGVSRHLPDDLYRYQRQQAWAMSRARQQASQAATHARTTVFVGREGYRTALRIVQGEIHLLESRLGRLTNERDRAVIIDEIMKYRQQEYEIRRRLRAFEGR